MRERSSGTRVTGRVGRANRISVGYPLLSTEAHDVARHQGRVGGRLTAAERNNRSRRLVGRPGDLEAAVLRVRFGRLHVRDDGRDCRSSRSGLF